MIDRQQAHSLGRPSGRPGSAFFLLLEKPGEMVQVSGIRVDFVVSGGARKAGWRCATSSGRGTASVLMRL